MAADAFRQVTWVNLPGNPTTIEKGVEDCKDLMRSPQLRAFRDKLHDLRDLAREQSKEMAKSMLTKGTAKVLDEMASVADSVWIACNTSSLSSSLEVGLRLWGEEQRVNAIKNAGSWTSTFCELMEGVAIRRVPQV